MEMKNPGNPEFPCHDCGTNTIPWYGSREYYEVEDHVWAEAGAPGIGASDNGADGFFLCIGCLEDRLRRTLRKIDFKDAPVNDPSPWYTDRLNSRLSVVHKPENAPQYHPKAFKAPVITGRENIRNEGPEGCLSVSIAPGTNVAFVKGRVRTVS